MIQRTGNSKIAVVGWGRGMGHKGHMYLASSVITQAQKMNADAYFFVSKTVGKDDPIFPEEKVKIYQTVFPQQAPIFQPQGNLNQALTDLAADGYQGVVLIVGADQKDAFKYLERPNKEGVPVYQSMGLQKLRVISRQETGDASAGLEGPRATPMREVLLHPEASEQQKFKVWRDAMPDALGDKEVMDLMKKAEARLMGSHTKKTKVAESRIMDRDARINAYYVSKKGDKHRVAENIPYYLLDKLVPLLTKKYAITMNDIVVKPVDQSQYRRTSQPELAEGMQANPNQVAELLYKVKPEIFSRFGDDFVMDAIAQACEQHTGSAQEVAVKVVDILKQGINEGWKEKVAGGALALGALGGIGALQNAAPNTTFQGHQLQLANPGTQPQDAKLVTDDNGKKIYAWKTTGQKNRSQWVYRPAEEVKEGIFDRFKKKPAQPEVADPGNYPRIGSDIAQWMAATVAYHKAKFPDSVWKLFCPTYPDYLPVRVRVGTSEKIMHQHLEDYINLRNQNPEAVSVARQKFDKNNTYPSGPRDDYTNKVSEQAVAEGVNDTIYPNAEVIKSKNGKPLGEIYQDQSGWGCFHYKADLGADSIESREEAIAWLKDLHDEYRQDRSLREAGFDREEFRRHMEQLRAREELRKTDPVAAKALDLRGQLPQQSKKKPEDDSIGINDPRHPSYAYTQAGQHKVDEDDRYGMKDGRPYSDPLRRHPGNESYMTPEYLIQKYKERLAQIAAGPYKRPKEVAQLQSRIAKLSQQGVAESEEDALAYATKAHAGQTRSGGDPYITHPMRVADHIRQYKQSHNLDALISAAYLHDTIEDTSTTQEALHDLFGGLVASLVQELTSDPEQIKKMGKKHYLAHKMAAMSSYGLVIKLADRLDNVKDITTAKTPEWRHKYAQETAHILDYIEKTRALSGTHRKLIELIRAKLAEIDNPQQPDEQLDEFAPGNSDDDMPTAEYQVYQCQLDDQFDWIGGPLFQSDDMGKVHGFAYEMWKKHPDKCFMIWQERSQGSRGGYGPVGSVLAPSQEDLSESNDYLDEK